jgi:hypothetical protein
VSTTRTPPCRRRTDPVAACGLGLSLVGVVPVAVVLDLIALRRIRRSGDRGRSLAVAGLAVCALWTAVLVAGIGLTVAAFTIMSPNDPDDFSLVQAGWTQAGPCLIETPADPSGEHLAVRCDRAHQAQVAAVFDLPAGAYPGTGALQAAGRRDCPAHLRPAVAARLAGGELTLHLLYPASAQWQHSQQVACVLSRRDGRDLTESVT